MDALKLAVILGSTRKGRFGEKPAKWIVEEAKKHGFDVNFLDLRDHPLPFFDKQAGPMMAPEQYESEAEKKWALEIKKADAYLVVTPEYNHGYSAVLKNAMDYCYVEWINKPIGFVAYGAVGGTRAVEQLRQVAIELQMAPVRNAVHIHEFWNQLDEKGNLKTESLQKQADALLDQLMWWATALKAAREQS
jgi:NAD(P)H-dependent FMN reductase